MRYRWVWRLTRLKAARCARTYYKHDERRRVLSSSCGRETDLNLLKVGMPNKYHTKETEIVNRPKK